MQSCFLRNALQGWSKAITKAGEGAAPRAGQKVYVHCTGTVQATGHVFWSTTWEPAKGGGVFSFNLGRKEVIPAWDEGVATMKIGEKATITATHEVAYGDAGFPAWGIPPRATLVFDIELLDAK